MAGPWFYRSLATGTGDGLSWANARVTLATQTSVVAGDTIWVADDHNETATGTVTLTFAGTPTNPNIIICADHNVASPGTNDWKTTGVITGATSGASNSLDINGCFYCYGLTFRSGVGASTTAILRCQSVAANSGRQIYDTCAFYMASTQGLSSCLISFGTVATNLAVRVVLINTTVQFANAGQWLRMANSTVEWRNTATPFLGTQLTNAFTITGPCILTCEGMDFSSWSAGGSNWFFNATSATFTAYINNCRFHVDSVPWIVTPANLQPSQAVFLNGSGADTTAAWKTAKHLMGGSDLTETAFRTGGASDGTRSFCRKLITRAGATGWTYPFVGTPIVKWNATTAANVSMTVYGCCSSSAPTNDMIWLEFSWLGNAGYPLASMVNTTKANSQATGTALTADTTSTWDCPTTRSNSSPYALGDVFKVASNPGKVFLCTVAGNSSGTVPGGYATATDGTSITDGGCTFVCAYRFAITYTMASPQPQLAGPVYITPKASATGALVVLLDPEVV